MRIISKAKLREFWAKHPKAADSLKAWHRNVELADWSNPLDVRNTYRSADPIGDEFVVFDICKNDYRLVVRVDYGRSIVYIWGLYTHAQYSQIDFKAIDEEIEARSRERSLKTSRLVNSSREEVTMAITTEPDRAKPQWARYLGLVQEFPLRPIRSDEELTQAIKVIDSLIIRGDLDSGEQDYLDVLSDLVEKYEDDEHPMPAVSDAVMLRHLIEARGITQSKLASDVEIPVSTISEILSGKRHLNRRHMSILAKYFNVNPSVFRI